MLKNTSHVEQYMNQFTSPKDHAEDSIYLMEPRSDEMHRFVSCKAWFQTEQEFKDIPEIVFLWFSTNKLYTMLRGWFFFIFFGKSAISTYSCLDCVVENVQVCVHRENYALQEFWQAQLTFVTWFPSGSGVPSSLCILSLVFWCCNYSGLGC